VSDPLDLDVHLPAIASGDTAAFARWLSGAEPAVRASLRSFAARVDVEAVVQETLLRAWQVAPRVEPDGRPNGLLRVALRAARNLAIDDHRRSGRREEPVAPDHAALATTPDDAPQPADPLLRRVIAACFEKLPAQPGAALRARLDAAGADADAALATRCQMRLNTFLQNVARARKHLLACLAENGVILATTEGGGAP
jgi:DNA-directed RNA polymerase specialized sigma24 family protein